MIGHEVSSRLASDSNLAAVGARTNSEAGKALQPTPVDRHCPSLFPMLHYPNTIHYVTAMVKGRGRLCEKSRSSSTYRPNICHMPMRCLYNAPHMSTRAFHRRFDGAVGHYDESNGKLIASRSTAKAGAIAHRSTKRQMDQNGSPDPSTPAPEWSHDTNRMIGSVLRWDWNEARICLRSILHPSNHATGLFASGIVTSLSCSRRSWSSRHT